jgi:hypothetical protein
MHSLLIYLTLTFHLAIIFRSSLSWFHSYPNSHLYEKNIKSQTLDNICFPSKHSFIYLEKISLRISAKWLIAYNRLNFKSVQDWESIVKYFKRWWQLVFERLLRVGVFNNYFKKVKVVSAIIWCHQLR